MIRTRIRRHLVAVMLAAALGLPPATRIEASEIQSASAAGSLGAGFRSGRVTGYPVPRFVSIKSANAHMRVGPSTDYATNWVYSARGLPLEIIEEYGNWRQVRDQDGTSGWMFAPLLSGRRTAVIGPWMAKSVKLHSAPRSSASVIAELAPSVRLNIRNCDGSWCDVSLQSRGLSGYVAQTNLWGVYPHERLE